jgi:hypothetical protein
MRRSRSCAFVFALTLCSLSVEPAHACSCGGGDRFGNLRADSVVFLGKAASRIPWSGGAAPVPRDGLVFEPHRAVTFEALAFWKGSPARYPVVESYAPGGCGAYFEVGSTFLVIARERRGRLGETVLTTHLCMGNRLVRDADQLGEVLDRLGPPVWGTTELP